MTSMENKLNGRQSQWETNSTEDDLNEVRLKWKMTSMEDDCDKWKTTSNNQASQFCTLLGPAQPQLVISFNHYS